ncbi:plasminogen-like [Pecten maximus]|uniref:plasminogen-like n=1 Tax=Pecten maximus TaxID=6579 RepID=UPI001458900E|nr:plasminogen-like [Pecten maximus]
MRNYSLSIYKCQNFDDPEPAEFCPVSRCDQNWTKASLSCSAKDLFDSSDLVYGGRISCTVKGVTCQRWDRSSPHEPHFLINRSDLQNWCQIESSARPWCYTMDPKTRWDYCPVEEVSCGEPPLLLIRGTSVTIEWPYNYATSIARYSCSTLADIKSVSSCPVTRCLQGGSWTTANISCSSKECYDPSKETYTGSVTCTQTGITCQRWDSNYPHTPRIFEGRSDLGNRCVLATYKRPWCYTVDPAVDWDFCPVDECS